jgi:hypothetical protein
LGIGNDSVGNVSEGIEIMHSEMGTITFSNTLTYAPMLSGSFVIMACPQVKDGG